MATYKLLKNLENGMGCVLRDGKDSIPFALDNTDYAQFKKAVAEGAELQDADGNVMSPEAAQAFVGTLP
jgi:hypothetical protein